VLEEFIELLGRENISVGAGCVATYFKKFPYMENCDDVRDIVSDVRTEFIMPFYQKINIDVRTGVYNILVEPLKNANFHGGNYKIHDVEFGLILTDKLLIASYFDGGDFFGREDIKNHFENRTRFEDKHIVPGHEIPGKRQVGLGLGMTYIYDFADIIKVDINTKTMYLGLKTDNVLFFQKY